MDHSNAANCWHTYAIYLDERREAYERCMKHIAHDYTN